MVFPKKSSQQWLKIHSVCILKIYMDVYWILFILVSSDHSVPKISVPWLVLSCDKPTVQFQSASSTLGVLSINGHSWWSFTTDAKPSASMLEIIAFKLSRQMAVLILWFCNQSRYAWSRCRYPAFVSFFKSIRYPAVYKPQCRGDIIWVRTTTVCISTWLIQLSSMERIIWLTEVPMDVEVLIQYLFVMTDSFSPPSNWRWYFGLFEEFGDSQAGDGCHCTCLSGRIHKAILFKRYAVWY